MIAIEVVPVLTKVTVVVRLEARVALRREDLMGEEAVDLPAPLQVAIADRGKYI